MNHLVNPLVSIGKDFLLMEEGNIHEPLLVASSSSGMSTALAGKWTYLTTEPLMNTFLTELCITSLATVLSYQSSAFEIRRREE